MNILPSIVIDDKFNIKNYTLPLLKLLLISAIRK